MSKTGLVREADVFSQGYRPGTLAARGLAPERLAEMRPGELAEDAAGGSAAAGFLGYPLEPIRTLA